jgi:hypothetical protein
MSISGLLPLRTLVEGIFGNCNRIVSHIQALAPSLTEPQLDGILISQLICQPPLRIQPFGCEVEFTCSFIGGTAQFEGLEIGDLLFSLRVNDSSGFRRGKLALCQSKALKAKFVKSHNQYEFQNSSRYTALLTKTASKSKSETQYARIERYEKSVGATPVFYLLYNPTQVPSVVNYSPHFPKPCDAGIRVMSTQALRRAISNAGDPSVPTFDNLKPIQHLRLEEFVGQLVSCQLVAPTNSEEQFNRQRDQVSELVRPSFMINIEMHVDKDLSVETIFEG